MEEELFLCVEDVLRDQYPEAFSLNKQTLKQAISGSVDSSVPEPDQSNLDIHTIALQVKDIATIVSALVAFIKAGRYLKNLLKPTKSDVDESAAKIASDFVAAKPTYKQIINGVDVVAVTRVILVRQKYGS